MCFYQTGYSDFRSDCKLFCDPLTVIILIISYAVRFHLAISAVHRSVVTEHIKRCFAEVQAFLAKFRFILFISFADLILHTTAF